MPALPNVIIVNDDNTVVKANLNPKLDWENEALLNNLLTKTGGVVYEGTLPENNNLKMVDGIVVVDTERENSEKLEKLRVERTKRLVDTDNWVLPDRTPTQAQLDYRQALRDITDTYSSLEDAVFPVKP